MNRLRMILLLVLTAVLAALPSPSLANPLKSGPDKIPAGTDPGTDPKSTGAGNPGGIPGGAPGGTSGGVPGQPVPRLMLTAFSTTPEQVTAGAPFTVSFTLENKSRRTRVSNIKVTLASDGSAFLPASGSSSIYISSIKPGGSVSRELSFNTLPTLEERPYPVALQIEYEDGQATPYQSQETAAVIVRQTSRADASMPQANPATISVGQDSSVTFSLNNLGKNKIYNARVAVKPDQHVTANEVFTGTIEPGASSSVDLLVHAKSESAAPVILVISYEDANGKVQTLEKTVELSVQEAKDNLPGGMEVPMPEEPSLPIGLLLIPLGLAAVIGLAVWLIVRARRKRQEQANLASDMSLLDGGPLAPMD